MKFTAMYKQFILFTISIYNNTKYCLFFEHTSLFLNTQDF